MHYILGGLNRAQNNMLSTRKVDYGGLDKEQFVMNIT